MKFEEPTRFNPSQPPLVRAFASRIACLPHFRGGADAAAPSPDKGRDGEGLGFASEKGREGFIPYNKKLIPLARENRKNPTAAESKLWNEVLRMRQFADYKFSRQKPLGNYIADFCCAALDYSPSPHPSPASGRGRSVAEGEGCYSVANISDC